MESGFCHGERWALPGGLCAGLPSAPRQTWALSPPLTESQGPLAWAWPLPTSSGMVGFKAWRVWGLQPGLAALWGLLEPGAAADEGQNKCRMSGPGGHGRGAALEPCPALSAPEKEEESPRPTGLRGQEKGEAEAPMSGCAECSDQLFLLPKPTLLKQNPK